MEDEESQFLDSMKASFLKLIEEDSAKISNAHFVAKTSATVVKEYIHFCRGVNHAGMALIGDYEAFEDLPDPGTPASILGQLDPGKGQDHASKLIQKLLNAQIVYRIMEVIHISRRDLSVTNNKLREFMAMWQPLDRFVYAEDIKKAQTEDEFFALARYWNENQNALVRVLEEVRISLIETFRKSEGPWNKVFADVAKAKDKPYSAEEVNRFLDDIFRKENRKALDRDYFRLMMDRLYFNALAEISRPYGERRKEFRKWLQGYTKAVGNLNLRIK